MAAWTHIAHDSLSLPAAAVTWSSIPSSYDHLCIKASIRTAVAGNYDSVNLQFGNGSLDTGTNYSMTNVQAFNAASPTPTSGRGSGLASIWYIYVSGNNATADTFGSVEIWIPNYANAANFKQAFCTSTAENASTTAWGMMFTAGLWSSTSAIDTVGFTGSTDDFMANSTFDLYGVTGA